MTASEVFVSTFIQQSNEREQKKKRTKKLMFDYHAEKKIVNNYNTKQIHLKKGNRKEKSFFSFLDSF